MNVRVGEDFWCEIDGLSGADQVQGGPGNELIKDNDRGVSVTNSTNILGNTTNWFWHKQTLNLKEQNQSVKHKHKPLLT